LVSRACRYGLYWPTAVTDAKDLVKRCKGCQFFAKQQHLPAQALRTIPPSWPFAMWGLDAIGLFRTALGGYKHILVVVDKFTKWIEVRPVAKVTSEAVKFIGDIIHRFDVPNRIITDLGKASLARSSGTSAKITSLTSTIPRPPTHGVTARSKEPTAWCSKHSRTVSTTTPPTSPPDG
jgi:hypothetical protein